MVIKDPCGICKKPVATSHNALMCDVCNEWVHIRCNFVPKENYNHYIDENLDPLIEENDKSKWFCNNCFKNNLPFGQLDENSFYLNSKGILNSCELDKLKFSLHPSDKEITDLISKLILENTDPDSNNKNFCSYYETEDFIKAKFDNNTNFSILHLNIASLQFHFEELKILLKMLDYEFDCITITETKLIKNVNPSIDIDIPNYHYFHTPTEACKGGSLIYISNKLISKQRKDLEIYQPKEVESTFCEITIPNGKNIIVGCVYKHHTIDPKDFASLFLPTLQKANKEKKTVLVAGDFNIDFLKLNKDVFTNNYFDSLTNINFMPLITLPTRITSRSKTLIDNILFNQFSQDIKSGNLNVSISDHSPQFAIIPFTHKKHKLNTKSVFVRNYRNYDQQNVSNTFQSIDWNSSTNQHLDTNELSVDHDLNSFLDKSNKVINDLFPYRKLSNKELKSKHNPWITNEILKEIKIRDKLYSKQKKATDIIRKEDLQLQLRNQKNKVRNLLRSSKKIYFSKYFEENSRNAKKLWEGVNRILSSKSKSNKSIDCLEVINNNVKQSITNPKEIANVANKYFTNIPGEILKNRKYKGNKHFRQYLKRPNLIREFTINPIHPKEVEQIINDFDTSKSVGPNSLPPKILKLIGPLISKPIADICNKSFKTGKYPDLLKISKINPLHKKDSKLSISNYRPISLLSNLNKIIEKIMFSRLYTFLQQGKCIYDLQFGFRENHSTNHAIISIVQKIQEAIKDKNIAIGIFIDLQKAFDTVNHLILLEKLNHYGISGITNAWFKSYLTDRKQFVSIDGVDSDYTTIEHGVPQGSVLGPLLFLIYINDLHQCIKNSNTLHFADDTNLLFIPPKRLRNKNLVRRLNIDLKSLNNWLLANKISLNSSKTELIIFRDKNTPLPNLSIKLNGSKLKPKSMIKYLGMTIDEHLNFKSHINIMNAKLKRANNLLALSRHYLPRNILKQVYYAQFHSHLSYGCQVWGQSTNNINQTLSLQKKAIRLMTFSHKDAPTNPLFKDLQILQLNDIIKTNNVIFVHKTINGLSPSHFDDFYELHTPIHRYNTVNNPNSLYSIPAGSVSLSNIENNTLKYKCAQDWNQILKIISASTNHTQRLLNISIPKLKSITKAHFISAY